MLLKELETWIVELKAFWYQEVEMSLYENKNFLKTQINENCDLIINNYSAYLDELKVDSILAVSDQFFSYIMTRYVISIDGAPSFDSVLGVDDDARPLYIDWYIMPDDYSTMFELSDSTSIIDSTSMIVIDGIVNTEQPFLDIILILENGVLLNTILCNIFNDNLTVQMDKRMTYQTFHEDNEIVSDDSFDIKEYIITQMNVGEILDYFGWEVSGLNV